MRTKKAMLISVMALLALAIKSVTNIIVLRLMIRSFGYEMNGVIAAAGQLMEYLSILEGGIGAAIVAMLFLPLAQANHGKVSKIMIAANRYYRRIGLLFSVCLLLLAYVYAFYFQDQVVPITVFGMIVLAGAVQLPTFFIAPGYSFLLMADQREYVANILNSVFSLLGPCAMIVLMQMDYSIYAVRSVPILISLGLALCLRLYVLRKYEWLDTKCSSDIVLRSQVKDMMIHKLSGLVVFNSDMVITSLALGFSQVSIYSIYNSIFYMAKNVVAPVIASGRAGIGQLLAEQRIEQVRKVFSTYEYMTFMLVFILMCTLSIIATPFITLYTQGLGDLQYSDIKLTLLFSVLFTMDLIRSPHQAMISAAGHFKHTKYRALTEGLINLVMSLLLVRQFGLYGVLLGTIAAFGYRIIDIHRYVCREILQISVRRSVMRVLRNTVCAIPLGLIGIAVFPVVDNFADWFGYSVLSFIAVSLSLCLMNYVFESDPFVDFVKRILSSKFKKVSTGKRSVDIQ